MNNASILRVGIKRSLQNQTCNNFRNRGMTGSSRSVAISHYMKRLFTSNAKVDQSMNRALNGGFLVQPSGSLGRSFFTSKMVSNAFSGAKRSFSTSVVSHFRIGTFSLNEAAASAATAAAKSASRSGKRANPWPINTAKPLGYLCIGCSILVFAIVVLGGLTRLTESGLSITEWKPVTGAIPPLNEQQWQEEFEKYQQSPEYKELNTHMTLQEYKFIYGMEWSTDCLVELLVFSSLFLRFITLQEERCLHQRHGNYSVYAALWVSKVLSDGGWFTQVLTRSSLRKDTRNQRFRNTDWQPIWLLPLPSTVV